jgi:hypothetical protein
MPVLHFLSRPCGTRAAQILSRADPPPTHVCYDHKASGSQSEILVRIYSDQGTKVEIPAKIKSKPGERP